ncbi:MAG: cytochrome C oxidase Cbb3 [Arcobacter sp.]|nr:cytochrome C oxidase Cbb3 [Arcobacter sp.]|tara:strand:+ start:892 stop:1341 length:450 start_codon:yes stop_codon:yes gene_type:complete
MKSKFLKVSVVVTIITAITFFILKYNKDLKDNKRWYTQEQVNFGKTVFANNCAVCHGYNAEKTINWKKTLPDSSYPPPPLNDKAHAWHHPKWQLMQIITEGGKPYDGNMPPFKNKLTKKEKEATIAYFQSFWDDKHYNLWLKYGGLKAK